MKAITKGRIALIASAAASIALLAFFLTRVGRDPLQEDIVVPHLPINEADELRSKEEYDRAIALYSEVIQKNPSEHAFFGRARCWIAKREYERAVEDYSAAIRWNSGKRDYFLGRAKAYESLADRDLALKDYEKAVELGATDPFIFLSCGWLRRQGSEQKASIRDFDRAILLDPKYQLAYLGRGICREETGDFTGAIEDYSNAHVLNPNDSLTLRRRAWIYATCPEGKLRAGKKALGDAQKAAAQTDWKDPSVLNALAAAHAECGDYPEAIRWQKKSLELRIDDKGVKEEGEKALKLYLAGISFSQE